MFDVCAGERSAPVGNRIAGLGGQDETLVRVAVDHDLREQEDRFLRSVRRDDFLFGAQLDAEPAPTPLRDGGSQLGEPFGERISQPLLQRVDQRLADRGIGRLHRVAFAEVDQVDALSGEAPLGPLELDERIRTGGAKGWREVHDLAGFCPATA